jgi:uncharacterized protein (DUF58 family)
VVVYPSIDPQPGFQEMLYRLSGEIAAHYRGKGNDFYRIRPYEAFESARHVDWKATAHTGELQVREFARDQEHEIEILLDLDVPESAADWFEQAVDCAAFLVWSMAQKGARVRLRTHEFTSRCPEDCDVYTILRYLALVTPARGKTPPALDDENTFHVVFTANLSRVAEHGWNNARVFGPDALSSDFPAGRAQAGAAEELDHHHREDRD